MGKILIADDIQMTRSILSAIADRLGCESFEAENGKEVLELVSTYEFDIIILDIAMPVMNGIETLQELRKRNVKAHIIMITGHATRELLLQCVDQGISDFITKPFATSKLESKLRSLLFSRRDFDSFKLLIVDDSLAIRNCMKKFLSSDIPSITEASSGMQCLGMLEEGDFSLIFLDIEMPGISGIKTLQELRKVYPDLPVVIVTSTLTKKNITKCSSLGVSGFIQKPFKKEHLINSIMSHVLPPVDTHSPYFLVADDTKLMRFRLKKDLSMFTDNIYEACNGLEALAKIKEIPFDLIFLDIEMPEMTGLEVLENIRRNYPDLKVVIISSIQDKKTISRCISLGVSDFISKPFNSAKLRARVTEILG